MRDEFAEQTRRTIDRLVAAMPTVDWACNTCALCEVPPKPADMADGWLATCRAPLPANVGPLRPMSIPALDVTRWQGKRLNSCPCWSPK